MAFQVGKSGVRVGYAHNKSIKADCKSVAVLF